MMARRDDAPWKPSNLAKAAKIGNVVERITHLHAPPLMVADVS